jgi:hypothetical protein
MLKKINKTFIKNITTSLNIVLRYDEKKSFRRKEVKERAYKTLIYVMFEGMLHSLRACCIV